MAIQKAIQIPNHWKPRDYQVPLWQYMENGGKRAVCVWHRRAGKDSVALNWTARAAFSRVGTYWHMLPTQRQGRRVVWEGLDREGRRMIDQAFPPELRSSTQDQEMRIRLANGSVWQCVGSDAYDSLVGANPVGVTFSEYAIADPQAYSFLRPILAENEGWAIFIYTPRGENHGSSLYRMAKQQAGWFSELLDVEATGAIPISVIDEERASGMPESLIQQEYFCDFASGVAGAYYSEYMNAAEKDGRITRVPHEATIPVTTAWDLGIDDATVIWFVQTVNREIRLIDYYEASGVGLEHYAKVLKEKPYSYDRHLFPHDVSVRELGTGRSREEMLQSLGVRPTVVPRIDVEDGINAVRAVLGKCYFDEVKCERGLMALRSYRTEYDSKLGTFKARPLHDWSSHASDAFRYLATGLSRNAGMGGTAPNWDTAQPIVMSTSFDVFSREDTEEPTHAHQDPWSK